MAVADSKLWKAKGVFVAPRFEHRQLTFQPQDIFLDNVPGWAVDHQRPLRKKTTAGGNLVYIQHTIAGSFEAGYKASQLDTY